MRRRARDPRQGDLLQQAKEEYLRQARTAAEIIAYETGSVSAEDVRRRCPIPGGIHKNVMGRLFCDRKTFIFAGIKKSATPTRKGGIICTWRLTDEAHAQWQSHYERKAG